MVDTIAIVLTMDKKMFGIFNPDVFEPSAKGVLREPYYSLGRRGNFSCYLNPTKKEQLDGRYYPYITLTRRRVKGGHQTVMKIEFSIPKLLYKNNFDEVANEDFELIINTLKTRLAEREIYLSEEELINTPVSKIHYSKNIILEKFGGISLILNELYKADMNLWLDLEEVKYRNAGYGIKFRNNCFELAIYDKERDLAKGKTSDKKAEEKDNAIQLNFLEPLKQERAQILRIEARLNSRQKIRQIFKLLGIQAEPTFKEVFNSQISKKILQYYWQELEEGCKNLDYKPENATKLLTELIANNPNKRPSTLLKATTIKLIIEETGVRGFRNLLAGHKASNWKKISGTLDSINLPKNLWSPLKEVGNKLEKFKKIKLEKHKDKIYTISKQWQVRKEEK